jgi:hypothetical protein
MTTTARTNNGDFIRTVVITTEEKRRGTGSGRATGYDLAELVDGSAAFYAHYQRRVVEDELRSAEPSGEVLHLLVAGIEEDRVVRELHLPEDADERRDYCYELAEEVALEVPFAAVMSCPGVSHANGREIVLVFASDRAGGHEAWAAEVTRAHDQPPRIGVGGWKPVELCGAYPFMVHAVVGNFAGMRAHAESSGVPRAFFPRLQPL